MTMELPSRNIGLDLVRVTETAALAAGRFIGSGDYEGAHRAATRAMAEALDTMPMQGRVVIGEDGRIPDSPLESHKIVGKGDADTPSVDVVADPIDGTRLLIRGSAGAISVVGVAPRDTIWSPTPCNYIEKIVVDRTAAAALVPECLDAPAAWTLALVARVKGKSVRDLQVAVLDRPRHRDLVNEIRAAGARVLLRTDGDAEGALLAATPESHVDLLMGIGGAAQTVLSACMVQALKGGMLARLSPQDQAERALLTTAGLDTEQILTVNDMVRTDEIFFAATGITTTPLLPAMQFYRDHAETHSLLIRGATGTRRFIHAEHLIRPFNQSLQDEEAAIKESMIANKL